MNKAMVLEIAARYNLAPNKKLGQNFLINEQTIERIIEACSPDGQDLLEIGPGLGSISTGLARRSASYTAVEIDSGFYRYLCDLFKGESNVKIVHGDFLKTSLDDRFSLIVSNLPYYCSSEILFRIAEDYTAENVYVMVQKEMGERLVSKPGVKSYGAMTVALSYYYDIKHLFYVPGDSFYPRPEVKSSFLSLKRKARVLDRGGEEIFHLLVKSAFWGRRKTLARSLADSPHLSYSKDYITALLEKCSIDSALRGESLRTEDYIKLTEAIIKNEIS